MFAIVNKDVNYKDELNDFVNTLENKNTPSVTFEDGRNALILANAAYESFETAKSVKVNFN